jgi:hypothetical protein
MPLTEFDAKEALRAATDWLATSSAPGAADAQGASLTRFH